MKKVLLVTFLSCLVLLSGCTKSPESPRMNNSVENNEVLNITDQEPIVEVPDYEIVSDNGAKWDVYTESTTDKDLIAITDSLLQKPRELQTHLFIRYFDDKEVAAEYWDKLLDENVSETEKDELYSHFVAQLNYNETTGKKQLERVYGVDSLTIIKQY